MSGVAQKITPFLLLLLSVPVFAQPQKSRTLQGEECVACHHQAERVTLPPQASLFAEAPKSGVFSLTKPSESALSHWECIGVEGGAVTFMAPSPVNPQQIYAIIAISYNYSKLYLSENGGESWTLLGELTMPFQAIAFHPGEANVLYACGGGYFYKSTDAGHTWNSSAVDMANWPYLDMIYVVPTNPDIIYLVGRSYSVDKWVPYLYRSLNGGSTWSKFEILSTPFNYVYLYAFAVDPDNEGRLFVSGYKRVDNQYSGFVVTSVDSGQTWQDWTDNLNVGYVYDLIISKTSPKKLYASGQMGVGWREFTAPGWQQSSSWAYGYKLHQVSANPNILYAGAYYGIYKSIDGGQSWLYTEGPKGRCSAVLASTDGNKVLFASNLGVYCSQDGGTNWAPSCSGMLASSITAISVSPSAPNTLYIEYDGMGIFKSTDAGSHWQQLPEFLDCGNICEIGIHPNNPDVAFALEGSG